MSSATAPDDVGKPLPSEDDPRPVVALPPPALPGAVIAVVAVLLAVLLFVMLDAQRRSAGAGSAQPERASADAFTQPPPLVVPPDPAPSPVVAVITTTTVPTPPVARQDPVPRPFSPAPSYTPPVLVPIPATPQPSPSPLIERRQSSGSAPALVFDSGEQAAPRAGTTDGSSSGSAAGRAGGAGTDDTPARVTRIANQTNVMPTGTIIPAVLETPIDTARPGLLRALVSEDTRGFDGRRVLVPKGSRLIGEYQADVRANQNRVLVTWTRLIRPDGAAIRLGSPASDPLGGAGVPGRLHTYFFERFASAVLQSALTIGVNLASRPRDGSVIVGLPGATVNNVVGQGLIPQNSLQPKITVKQGTAVNVFVARDLDFSGVASRP